jgi:hypothetical protein
MSNKNDLAKRIRELERQELTLSDLNKHRAKLQRQQVADEEYIIKALQKDGAILLGDQMYSAVAQVGPFSYQGNEKTTWHLHKTKVRDS